MSEELSKSLTVMTHKDKAEEDEKEGFLDIEQDVVPIIVAPSSKSDDDEEEEEEEEKNSTLLTSLPPPDLNMICTAIEKKWKGT